MVIVEFIGLIIHVKVKQFYFNYPNFNMVAIVNLLMLSVLSGTLVLFFISKVEYL